MSLDSSIEIPEDSPAKSVSASSGITASFELREKIADLQEKLLSAHPLMPVLLRTIHTQLRADAELVTTLSEEEVGIIVNGLKLQTNTEIATAITKTPAAGTKIKKAIKDGNLLDLL